MIIRVSKDGTIEGNYRDNLAKVEQELISKYIAGQVGAAGFTPLHTKKHPRRKQADPPQSEPSIEDLITDQTTQITPKTEKHPQKRRSRDVVKWKESKTL